MLSVSARSATGITERKKAEQIAQGMADLYEDSFTVLFYPSEGIYDVEPARRADTPGVDFVVAVMDPPDLIQSLMEEA